MPTGRHWQRDGRSDSRVLSQLSAPILLPDHSYVASNTIDTMRGAGKRLLNGTQDCPGVRPSCGPPLASRPFAPARNFPEADPACDLHMSHTRCPTFVSRAAWVRVMDVQHQIRRGLGHPSSLCPIASVVAEEEGLQRMALAERLRANIGLYDARAIRGSPAVTRPFGRRGARDMVSIDRLTPRPKSNRPPEHPGRTRRNASLLLRALCVELAPTGTRRRCASRRCLWMRSARPGAPTRSSD